MGHLRAALVSLFVAGAVMAPAVSAQGIGAEEAYELSQAAIGRQVGAHVFTDKSGAPLALSDLRGRPLVISLIFTSCATVCPITTDNLRDRVLRARASLGDEAFAVLSFGFDASGDSPAQLAAFSGQHRIDNIPAWYVASADEATTEAFLADVGFSFAAAAGGFDHITQTTILDAEGRVYRQLYGEDYPLPLLTEPLKDLVLGRFTASATPGDLWKRLTFICTIYNPASGAYRFDYAIFFGIFFGAISLILTAVVILRMWLGNRRYYEQRRDPTS